MKFVTMVILIGLITTMVPYVVKKVFTPSKHRGKDNASGYEVHASTNVMKVLLAYIPVGMFFLLISSGDEKALISFGIIFIGLGSLNTIMYKKNRVKVKGEYLTGSRLFKKTRTVKFSEISKVQMLYDNRFDIFWGDIKICRVAPIYWGYSKLLKDLKKHNVLIVPAEISIDNEESK